MANTNNASNAPVRCCFCPYKRAADATHLRGVHPVCEACGESSTGLASGLRIELAEVNYSSDSSTVDWVKLKALNVAHRGY